MRRVRKTTVWVMLLTAMGLFPAASRTQEPVQVIDDEHLLQLVTKANQDYRANLGNLACREGITFVVLNEKGNPKRETHYEFDYSLPVDARRPVAVVEQRAPIGKMRKDFEARESVRDLNWRDLFRMFEPAYHENYIYGSMGEQPVEGRRAYIFEFRPVSWPVAGFDPTFEPFLEGYRVHIPLAGRALVDTETFRILSLELQGMGLPASRRFPIAKSIDFTQYIVTVDFVSVELGGKMRYLPKLIRSELATGDGRIIEERRYSNFHLLGK